MRNLFRRRMIHGSLIVSCCSYLFSLLFFFKFVILFLFLRLAVTRLLFGSFKSLRAHTHLFATSVTNVLILSLLPSVSTSWQKHYNNKKWESLKPPRNVVQCTVFVLFVCCFTIACKILESSSFLSSLVCLDEGIGILFWAGLLSLCILCWPMARHSADHWMRSEPWKEGSSSYSSSLSYPQLVDLKKQNFFL